ncbi:MAG: aspartate/glutamate racemase family protein [Burkholderiaceae bacterium]
MPLKIWYQSGVDFDHHPGYRNALTRRFTEVASPGTTVSLHGTNKKFNRGLIVDDCISSPWSYQMTYIPMFFSALQEAERTGYGAFIIGSLSEPALREMRSLATIPVLTVAESSMLTACTVAPKTAMVTLSKQHAVYIKKALEIHHLDQRILGIFTVDDVMTEAELDRSFDNPGPYIEKFKNAARVAIDQGADAIIAAEGMMAALMSINHVVEIDRVPLIDVVAAGVLYTEYIVAMGQRAGLGASRRFAYARPSAAALKALSDPAP